MTKPEAQALLHAVEELYFFRRYAEGAAFVRRVLDGDGDGDGDNGAPGLDEETRKLLRYYETRCVQRGKEADEAEKWGGGGGWGGGRRGEEGTGMTVPDSDPA